MTDTANAPERIWMTAEDRGASWSGAFRAFRCSDLDHSNDDGPNPDYPEYVLSTHCDELVAAAEEEAFARGANWAKEKARVEGRLVIVDSPELATLRADLAEAREKIARLTEALTPSGDTKAAYMGEFEFIVFGMNDDGEECSHKITVPWTAIKEIMAAIKARAALQENANE